MINTTILLYVGAGILVVVILMLIARGGSEK